MPRRDGAEPGEEDDSANGERTWEQEATVGKAMLDAVQRGVRSPEDQGTNFTWGAWVHRASRLCMWRNVKESLPGAPSWVCGEHKNENLGLEARCEGQQGWKDRSGPACEDSCSALSPVGGEVPLRVTKQRCDTVRGVFQLHPPSCRCMSLGGLTHWRWGGQGGGC